MALFARFSTPPSAAYKGAINAFWITPGIKAIAAKLDGLWLTAAANRQSAQRNWIADAYNLTEVSAPTFTANLGYTGDAASTYLRTGFTPSSASSPKFTLNSGAIGVITNAVRTASDAKVPIGASNAAGTSDALMFTYSGAGFLYGMVNDGAFSTDSLGAGSAIGRFCASRTGASTLALYVNGAQVGTHSVAAVAPVDNEILLLGYSSGVASYLTDDRIAAAYIGAGLSQSEVATLDAALATYCSMVAGFF